MLLDEYEHECAVLVQAREESDEGGWKTVWNDGEIFTNRMAEQTTSEVTKAEKDDIDISFTGLVDKACRLKYNDYFRDNVTGLTYRVTSDPDASQTPGSSSLDLKYYTAEREVPPT